MHRSEQATLCECADCGAEFEPERQEGFRFGRQGVLCFDCALGRGGSYDAPQDRWTVQPRLDGLPLDED